MNKLIEGVQKRRAVVQDNKKLQRKGTLIEFDNDFESQNNVIQQNDGVHKQQSNQQVVKKQEENGSKISTIVQIDEIMLFYLQQNLSKEIKDIIEIQLKKMHSIEKKIDEINLKLEQNLTNVQMISSLYNYAKTLKNCKGDHLDQYEKWNDVFPCQIVVNHDGNSFYRSFMLKYMLQIILSSNQPLLEKLILDIVQLPPLLNENKKNIPDLNDKEIKAIFIIFLVKNYQRISNNEMFSIYEFIKEYNSNYALGLSSIILIRNIIYQFYLKIKQSNHYIGWIQSFEKSKDHIKLITFGKEAEQHTMVLASQTFEVKVFALTFYQEEKGKVTSQINDFYMQQGDFNISIYLLFTNEQYNILFEQEFVHQNSKYFLQFIDVKNSQQNLTYFDKDGQRSRIASQHLDQESQQNIDNKEIITTNFFQRLQLEDSSLFLNSQLLTNFGFKKQINVPLSKNNSKTNENIWELNDENDEELPSFNPLTQQEYQLDFQIYLQMNQMSKIDSIVKKVEPEEQRELAQMNSEIKIPTQKKVRMSINLEINDIDENQAASSNNISEQKQVKSIYKKPSQLHIASEKQIQKQASIEEITKEELNESQVTNENVLFDKKCMDCDVFTSLKEKIIVMDIHKGIIICNRCVLKKVNIMKKNKLQSISFYGVEFYRFQMLDLLQDLEEIINKSVESLDKKQNISDESIQLIDNESFIEKQLTNKEIEDVNSKQHLLNSCAGCSRKIKEQPSNQNISFFVSIQNYNNSQTLFVCKGCLCIYYSDAVKSQYLNLMKIDTTYINPLDVIQHYDRLVTEQNKSGVLLKCQFYCKLEQQPNSTTMAADLFDTEENHLLQKKICLPCFQKILQSSMNIDDLVQMSCQIKLFSIIFKQDFLNDTCISCNISQQQGKNNYTLKSHQEQTNSQADQMTILFRVTEIIERFDSFVCLSCIKNLLIDQYTLINQNEHDISIDTDSRRQFKILYRRIGVLFQFTYSPLINNQILKALQNEAYKNQVCLKCQSQTSKPIYFLNNPDNKSICQSCFLIISKNNNKSDIISQLQVSEFQYRVIKDGMLQNIFSRQQCFCCLDENTQHLFHIWVKDYTRVLLICQTCLMHSRLYFSKDLFEITSTFFRERVLFQSIDIPQEIQSKEVKQATDQIQQTAQNECESSKQKSESEMMKQSKGYNCCLLCQNKQKKAIKMSNCSCWLCIKCISEHSAVDNQQHMICPSPYCIQRYSKIAIITYIDSLLKEEVQRDQDRQIKLKISRQTKDKYVCNSCRSPHLPVIITKQKYCSCVILCKPCLYKIYMLRKCYKCLEEIWNINKGDIELFDENQSCPSCLEPLDIGTKNQTKNSEKKQFKCHNCLYSIILSI